jgi:hypothetical protein
MNREWHKQHKMPDGATEEERIEWHREHARNCACRPAPKELLAKMEKQGAAAPASIGERRP